METTISTTSKNVHRRRKFLLILPVLVLPFITLAFAVLGGGRNEPSDKGNEANISGLNMELPGAHFEEKVTDKLGYYEKAALDSARLIEQMKNDPYYNSTPDSGIGLLSGIATESSPVSYPLAKVNLHIPGSNGNYLDPNEAKVYQKLAQLNSALNDAGSGKPMASSAVPDIAPVPNLPSDADRLEGMIQHMQESGANQEDPQLNQLSGMLEKILDIQHPERISSRISHKGRENHGEIFALNKLASNTTIGILDTAEKSDQRATNNRFWGAGEPSGNEHTQNSIEAVVHGNQTIVNGAVLKLRLPDPVQINGELIPKNQFVYGIVKLNNERLEVQVNSIRNGQSLFAVKLEVYDMDGLQGIYIPGAITRDVAKQSSDNVLQSVALNSLDPSVGAQAAGAGIAAAKTLLSKKVKLVRVQVRTGYKVLLKDINQQP